MPDDVALLAATLRAERAALLGRLKEIDGALSRIGHSSETLGIVQATARAFGLETRALLGRDRHQRVAFVRQVGMYFARTLLRPKPSYPDVARLFNRDHTTVYYAVHKVAELRETGGIQAGDIEAAERHVRGLLFGPSAHREDGSNVVAELRLAPGAR